MQTFTLEVPSWILGSLPPYPSTVDLLFFHACVHCAINKTSPRSPFTVSLTPTLSPAMSQELSYQELAGVADHLYALSFYHCIEHHLKFLLSRMAAKLFSLASCGTHFRGQNILWMLIAKKWCFSTTLLSPLETRLSECGCENSHHWRCYGFWSILFPALPPPVPWPLLPQNRYLSPLGYIVIIVCESFSTFEHHRSLIIFQPFTSRGAKKSAIDMCCTLRLWRSLRHLLSGVGAFDTFLDFFDMFNYPVIFNLRLYAIYSRSRTIAVMGFLLLAAELGVKIVSKDQRHVIDRHWLFLSVGVYWRHESQPSRRYDWSIDALSTSV